MLGRTKAALVGVSLAVLSGGAATGVAVAAGDDEALSGPAAERAKGAALEQTGGGRVVEAEIGDEGAAYSVEVRLLDGQVVEVSLDRAFAVVGIEADGDETENEHGEVRDDGDD